MSDLPLLSIITNEPSNLITNGDFEAASPLPPAYPEIIQAGVLFAPTSLVTYDSGIELCGGIDLSSGGVALTDGADATRVTTGSPPEGTYALQATRPVYWDVTLSTGTTCALAFWLRTTSGSVSVDVDIVTLCDVVGHTETFTADTTWAEQTVTFTVSTSGSYRLLISQASGTMQLDDVRLLSIGIPLDGGAFNILELAGFNAPPYVSIDSDYALLDGSYHHRMRAEARPLTIAGRIDATDTAAIRTERARIWQTLNPHRSTPPHILRYQPGAIDTAMYLDIVYVAGLAQTGYGWQQEVALDLIAHDPFWRDSETIAVSLTPRVSGNLTKPVRLADGRWYSLTDAETELGQTIDYDKWYALLRSEVAPITMNSMYEFGVHYQCTRFISYPGQQAEDPGQVFKYEADGSSTEITPTLATGETPNCVVYANNGELYLSTVTSSEGYLYRYTGGSSWTLLLTFDVTSGVSNTPYTSTIIPGYGDTLYISGNIDDPFLLVGIYNTETGAITSINVGVDAFVPVVNFIREDNGKIIASNGYPWDLEVVTTSANVKLIEWNNAAWKDLAAFINITAPLILMCRVSRARDGGWYATGGFEEVNGVKCPGGAIKNKGGNWIPVDIEPDPTQNFDERVFWGVYEFEDGVFLAFTESASENKGSPNDITPIIAYAAVTDIANVGTAPTYPVVTFTATAADQEVWQIKNYSTDVGVWFNLTLADGDVFVVDSRPDTRGCSLNGVSANEYMLPGSELAKLTIEPGLNHISIFAGADTTCNLEYQPRYLSGNDKL